MNLPYGNIVSFKHSLYHLISLYHPKIHCYLFNDEKVRTQGEYHKIGSIYGFNIFVKTESSAKDLFQGSVNRFFVKGEGSIYYTYNNGKLASDPKLACQNFLSALERIPKVMATHEKELTRASQDIEIYKAMASGQWNKEEALRDLKAQAAELDRKIALSLIPTDGAEGDRKSVV